MTNKTDFIPFSGILCQERAIEFLKRVISRGKIPHAYLFAGIPGIGKSTTALALTAALVVKTMAASALMVAHLAGLSRHDDDVFGISSLSCRSW